MFEPLPRGVKPDQRLKPKTHGIESKVTATMFIKTDFLRLSPKSSIPKATIFSKTATIVVRAAKLINIKKRVPQILPPAMELKIFGKVIKINPGPAPASTLKEAAAGKIISPDMIATAVSRNMMFMDSPVKLLFFSM